MVAISPLGPRCVVKSLQTLTLYHMFIWKYRIAVGLKPRQVLFPSLSNVYSGLPVPGIIVSHTRARPLAPVSGVYEYRSTCIYTWRPESAYFTYYRCRHRGDPAQLRVRAKSSEFNTALMPWQTVELHSTNKQFHPV